MVKIAVGNRKNKDGTETPLILYMDGNLHRELEVVKDVVYKQNFDYLAIISGRVGKGKSTFAKQMAKFCDKDFDLSRVCFSADEFVRVTTNCPQFSAVVLDEAFMDLNTQLSRSPSFLKVLNHLNIIRKRNLFLFICIPDFFDLHQSVALIRSEHLFYIYGEGFGGRGRFLAFGPDHKRNLYVLGKKFHNMNSYKSNFKGIFTGMQTVDEDEYDLKKEQFIRKKIIKTNKMSTWEMRTILLLLYFYYVEHWPQGKIAKIIKTNQQRVSQFVHNYRNVWKLLLETPNKYDTYNLLMLEKEKIGEELVGSNTKDDLLDDPEDSSIDNSGEAEDVNT